MKLKKSISILLAALLLLCCMLPAFAQEKTGARLYNVYGDHMLFQQKEDAVFAGEATAGTAVTVELKNAAGATVCSANGTAGDDGRFSVAIPAPAGGYDAYTVVVTAGNNVIARLSDVVFGELWLSFGQSNMEYTLNYTPEGMAMQAAGETGSSRIRVLQVPHPYNGSAFYSHGTPQTDAQGCYWFSADNKAVYGMSAVAYFFADQLRKELDMPVGVLNAAVGGSALAAWISREAIRADREVTLELMERGEYINQKDWDNRNNQYHLDMTGLYNSKIAPLTNFRIAGGIWYQGETDMMQGHSVDFYARMYDLMQKSYTKAFRHENGALPLIFTQIAFCTYGRGPYAVSRFNETFTKLAKAAPGSRGEVTISDIPLDYNEMGEIHPMTKKPIGQRMTSIAMGLVYGGDQPTSAPAMVKSEARDGSVFVTLGNVGDGLVAKDGALRCFSVYGDNGVCLPASAEIVSADTVRVFSNDVSAPVGAVYAANGLSLSANLYSSYRGAPYLPAAAFGMNDPAVTKLFDSAAWFGCDTLTAWQGAKTAGEKAVWVSENAALDITDGAAEGAGALRITAQKKKFSISPLLSEPDKQKDEIFDSMDTDYRAYGTLRLQLKNTGGAPVSLDGVRLYVGKTKYYTPVNTETGTPAATIPADGAWHTYSFDLDTLLPYGGELLPAKDSSVLTAVTSVKLCFTGKNAALCADDFGFTAKTEDKNALPTGFSGFIAFVKERFAAFFEMLKAIFGKVC